MHKKKQIYIEKRLKIDNSYRNASTLEMVLKLIELIHSYKMWKELFAQKNSHLPLQT